MGSLCPQEKVLPCQCHCWGCFVILPSNLTLTAPLPPVMRSDPLFPASTSSALQAHPAEPLSPPFSLSGSDLYLKPGTSAPPPGSPF